MPIKFDDLDKEMKRLGKRFEKNVNDHMVKVGAVTQSNLQRETPIDEGRARSNWLGSLNNPTNEQIESYSSGSNGSSAGIVSRAAEDQYNEATQGRKLQEDIYISNNLPYIIPLDKGRTSQTDPNFINRSIESAVIITRDDKFLE